MVATASAAAVVIGSLIQAGAGVGPSKDAGTESNDAAAGQQWFIEQRLAPNAAINSNAYASFAAQANALPSTSGSWLERTNPNTPSGSTADGRGNGNYFTDSPAYDDPVSNDSNSGAGGRYVGGRVTALASSPTTGTLFEGGADGGVWRSTNGGATWTPTTDHQPTLSIGALGASSDGTIYAGTGEANTNQDSYAGVGVLRSTDDGLSWTRIGGDALNGALIFRLAASPADPNTVLAATSHGLYKTTNAEASPDSVVWTAVLQPGGAVGPNGNFNLAVGNMISDVLYQPNTNAQQVVAVAGFRNGASTNGFYVSNDGGNTFTYLSNPQGWVPAKAQGRVTLAVSADGSRLYAIAQSPQLINVGTNGKTLLQGVYESNGGPNGPWTKIADSSKLANSGSAQKQTNGIGKGYMPGIQAWYNQSLAVDPADPNHVYLGLEEVYETQNGGAGWNTIGPYWNFTIPTCTFSYSPFEGNCNHDQSHSDQHAAIIAGGKVFVGNDGGVYSKALSDHTQGNWTDLNTHLDMLQYYAAMASDASSTSGSTIYGGLQDNGSSKIFPAPTTIPDDFGNPITVNAVSPFGGDGGYTVTDPNNPNNVMTEYTDLTPAVSTNGGTSWTNVYPGDPDPRFIAPIVLDRTDSGKIFSGGAFVYEDSAGFGITSPAGWSKIFDLTQGGAFPARTTTALSAVTVNGVDTVWAGWCGPCNPSFSTGSGFHSGVVELSDAGGAWHQVAAVTTGGTSGLPNRYVAGLYVSASNPDQAEIALSGYSRHWIIGPGDDPGVGHIFSANQSGGTIAFTDQSGNLPDGPAEDVMSLSGNLIAGTDIGVFVSSDGGSTWSRLGANLPNVVVGTLRYDAVTNQIVVASHGRGIWTFDLGQLSSTSTHPKH